MEKRILLLADAASPHTEKWASALADEGYLVGLFSLNKTSATWLPENKNIVLLYEPPVAPGKNKLTYLLALPTLWRILRSFRPHLIHAHYASSYGLLAALSGFRPFVVSAWGSDVFDFPRQSVFHKYILKFNLSRANRILATSYALKGELWKYTKREVEVIPFGVDTEAFFPAEVKDKADEVINIGTIKSLEDIYGIETILEAARHIKNTLPSVPFRLFLIGGGNRQAFYKEMAENFGLKNEVVFTGKIPFKEVPYYHNLLDIFLNVSIVDESFGVSVIEAMACQKPVIVSRAPGLIEIVMDKSLGLLIEKGNSGQLADAIIQLLFSPDIRRSMGKAARQHVVSHYDFKSCLLQMTLLYKSFLDQKESGLPYPVNYSQQVGRMRSPRGKKEDLAPRR